jgi:hypothetical protein
MNEKSWLKEKYGIVFLTNKRLKKITGIQNKEAIKYFMVCCSVSWRLLIITTGFAV